MVIGHVTIRAHGQRRLWGRDCDTASAQTNMLKAVSDMHVLLWARPRCRRGLAVGFALHGQPQARHIDVARLLRYLRTQKECVGEARPCSAAMRGNCSARPHSGSGGRRAAETPALLRRQGVLWAQLCTGRACPRRSRRKQYNKNAGDSSATATSSTSAPGREGVTVGIGHRRPADLTIMVRKVHDVQGH